jgi:uncharacterized protein YndB with AHSA1/START domain
VKTIHHVLDIDAAPAPVWAALTEAEGLAGWWSTKLDTQSAAVGTQIRFTFAGDFNPVMEITSIVAPTALEWRCTEGHKNWDDDYGVYNFNCGYYLESLRLLCTTGSGKAFQPPSA